MVLVGVVVVLVLALTGLAWSQCYGGSDSPQIKTKEGVGRYLTDGKGMTLYYFKNDAKDKNSCTGPCLEKWIPYYAETLTAPAGSDAKEFSSFTRADGKKQSTFKGWPLYYFAGDKKPGDTNGQGVKDVWFVIDPVAQPSCL
jgi:predicted lipoprotein with Yx(FWY)xxD motif